MSIDSTHRTHPRAQLLIRPILALALAALSLPLASASAYADDAVTDPAVAEAQLQATASEEQTSEPVEETPPETDPEPVEPAPDLTTDETPIEPPAPAAEEPAPAETVAEPPSSSSPKQPTQQLQVEPQAVLAEPDCTVTGFSQNTQEDMSGSWINGALNRNNSDYAEGDFVPQKLDLDGLVPGTYTVGFTFDRTKNGKFAYDYVANLAISGSTGASATWTSSTADFDGPAPTTGGGPTETVTVAVTITFTITDATDDTATITWGGHIASELDYGPGSSAGFIDGAPYHFSVTATGGEFGCSSGKRDNQLMADAVDFATITVVKDAQPNSAQPFGFSIVAPNDLDADFDLVDNGTGQQSVTYHVPPGTTTVTETPVEGWNLTSITCTPIAGTVASPSVSLVLADDDNVTCIFVNARTASLEVDKLWVINGGDPVPEGSEPAHLGLGAQLKVDGVDKAWDTPHGGYLQGSTVSLSEQVTFGNDLCTWAGAAGGRLTSANGTATDAALPYAATLTGGANTYTITNTVTCDSALVLRKVVQNDNGGTAVPGDFTLTATPSSGPALTTPGSTDGTRYVVPGDSSFGLSEGALPAGYSLAGIDCGAGSTTTVTVPAGRTVTCTFTNVDSPGSLVLDKIVDPDGTGDTTPESAWHLSATPVGITGQPTIEGDGGASGATKAGLYQLAETGPDTHTSSGWTCRDDADATVPVVLGMVSIGVGDNVTCEITNTAVAPTLTLVKVVDPGDTGDGTGPEDFTLTATPDGIAGQDPVTGNGSVTETVKVGGYGLSESGPSTYEMTEAGWTCVDGTDPVAVTDDEVQVGLAQDVVCTVTNVAVPSSWMVEKSSDPASGTVMPGDVIDYTITVTKVGDGVPVRDFEVIDTLSGIDAAWVSGLVTDTGSAELDNGVITWSVDVLGDVPLTMTYSVTIGADAWGATLRNVVTPGPEPCIPPEPGEECDETTHVTPHHTLDKSVEHLATPGDGDDLVEPGEQLEYTLTVVNDTELAPLDTVVTDDLSDVLDNGSMVTTTEELAAQGAVLDGTTLTWTITGLAPGASIQLTYVVQVDEGAWGTTLRNVATPGDSGECIPPAGALECETTTPTPGLLTLVKDVDANDTGDTTPATAWHLSATPDEIAGQATIEGDGTASGAIRAGSYQLAEEGPATHTPGAWDCVDTGDDPVAVSDSDTIVLGAQDVVTCRITNTAVTPTLTLVKVVDPGDTGDDTGPEDFTLTATPQGVAGQETLSGPGPEVSDDVRVGTYLLSESGPSTYTQGTWSCADGEGAVPVTDDRVQVGLAQDVTCTITNTAIPSSWRVAKTSDPASGSTVMPGDVINYTITVTKVGDGVPVRNIQIVDTLTGIDTSAATGWVTDLLTDTGEALLGETGLLTWTIGELGSTPLTMTYSVTVGEDAWNSTLHNAVTPGPEPCIPPEPGVACDETTHFTPHHTLDKSVEHLATPGDGDDLVEPGERLEYSLTVVNDTENAVLDTVVADDLSDVLDNASMVTTDAQLAAQGLVLGGDQLTWTITGLAPGASLTVSYVVQVDAGAWDQELRNVATPGDSGECIPPEDARECETTTTTPPVTTMVVEKRDLETDEVLAGATFQLYADEDNARDENGDCTFASPPVVGAGDQLLGTVVTNGSGQALFTDLQHGCYLLVETAAPPGYALPANAVMGIEIDEDNFVRGGLMAPIVVTDFAEGLLAIVAKQQFELIDGEWVESDGVIDFGEQVKYVVRVEATGPKNFHDVEVSDYVPGWNPDDVTSTDRAVLVPGSAACAEGLACTVSVDPATQLITWDLGDLAPDLGETIGGTAEFVVEFPPPPPLEAGESAEATLWNVGFLDYSEVVGIVPDARVAHGRARTAGAFEMVQHRLVSNEVVISAFLELPPPAGTPPENPPPPPAPPGPELPKTGAPAGLGTMALLGGVMVGLGLLLSRRRRED